MGLEPIRHKHTPLKRACLPIPAHSQVKSIFIIFARRPFVNLFFRKALTLFHSLVYNKEKPGCSAVGSAPALGAGCRGFESLHSDQKPVPPVGGAGFSFGIIGIRRGSEPTAAKNHGGYSIEGRARAPTLLLHSYFFTLHCPSPLRAALSFSFLRCSLRSQKFKSKDFSIRRRARAPSLIPHSSLLIPHCPSYSPSFAWISAVIIA